MTKYINIDKSKSPCDSTNKQMPDRCVMEKITEGLGCNLPWKPTAIGNIVSYFFSTSMDKDYNFEIT